MKITKKLALDFIFAIALMTFIRAYPISFFKKCLEQGHNPKFTTTINHKNWLLKSTFILEMAYLTMHSKKTPLQELKQKNILKNVSISIDCYNKKNKETDYAYYLIHNNEKIGKATVHIDYDNKTARLELLSINPNYQNMNLGKHFFKILMKKLSEYVDIVHWHAFPPYGSNSTLNQLYYFYTSLGARLTLDSDGRSYTASIDPKIYKDYGYNNKIISYVIIEE